MKIDRIKSAQANFLNFQNNLIDTTFSNDGEVKVAMNGKLQIVSLEFNKNVNNEVVLKTINEAIEKVSKIVQLELMKVQKIMQS
jgi:DNA-binding protein YbaB